jgi:hypothetical protein
VRIFASAITLTIAHAKLQRLLLPPLLLSLLLLSLLLLLLLSLPT